MFFTLERLLFLSLGREFLRKYSCMLQLNQLYLIHQRALDFGRDQSKSDRKCLCDFVSYIFFAGVSICCNRSEDEYNLYSSLCGVDEVHLCGNVPLHHHHCPQCSHYPQVIGREFSIHFVLNYANFFQNPQSSEGKTKYDSGNVS